MGLNCITGKLQLRGVKTKGKKARVQNQVSENALANIKEQLICIIDKRTISMLPPSNNTHRLLVYIFPLLYSC